MLYNYHWEDDNTNFKDLEKLFMVQASKTCQLGPPQAKDVCNKKIAIVERTSQKQKLMRSMGDILGKINDELDPEYQDDVVEELRLIKTAAVKAQFQDVLELVNSSIGRRIYNVQTQKKKKKQKQIKDNYHAYYENNRRHVILQFPYTQLSDSLFIKQTFVFSPYLTGKGFNYHNCQQRHLYPLTFKEIQAEQTIKEVNKLFFRPVESDPIMLERVVEFLQKVNQVLTVALIMYMVFQMLVFYVLSEDYIGRGLEVTLKTNVLVGTIITSAFIWSLPAFLEFAKKNEDKSSFQKAKELIQDYLQKISQQSSVDQSLDSKRVKAVWEAGKNLLYISVRVDSNIDKNPSMIHFRK